MGKQIIYKINKRQKLKCELIETPARLKERERESE